MLGDHVGYWCISVKIECNFNGSVGGSEEADRQQAMVSSVNTPSWQLPKMNLFLKPTSLNQLEHWSKALLAWIQITPAAINNTSLNHTDTNLKF